MARESAAQSSARGMEGFPLTIVPRGMIKEFQNCITHNRESSMSGHEGLVDLSVVLAAYRSVQDGNAVKVPAP